MTELTPEKLKELSALLASAPPATAARMLLMFERVKVKGSNLIPTQDLLAALRNAGLAQTAGQDLGVVRLPSFDRLFVQPFENLFESGPLESLLPGSIPRAGLKEAWQHIAEHFIPADVAEIVPMGTAAILNGDLTRAYQLADGLRDTLMHALRGNSNEAIARRATSPACEAVLLRLLPLLIAHNVGKDIWAMAYGTKGELSEHGVASLSTQVRILEDSHPDAARELLLLTMATLPRPHEALRVLNKVSLGVDDRKLDMTEFSVIGRRVIAVATREAAKIDEALATQSFDGTQLASTVERYNQCLHGLERETRLAPDGPWRHEVVALRGRIGKQLEVLCQRASQLLEAALPIQRLQRHTITWTYEPKLDHPIDQSKIDAASRHLEFVSGSRLFAALAGFGAAREMAEKHASNHLNLVSEALLKAARQKDKPRQIGDWMVATASVLGVSEGQEVASVFQRRYATAQAAA